MAGTFQLTYVPGYTLSDSSRGFSSSAVLTKTTARFPSSSCLDHKLTGRLKCAAPNSRRPFVCRSSSDGYRERFEKWLHTHGISYSGKEEWMRRFEIYKSNLQYIDYTNSLNLSYKLTDNKFADLTGAEFRARYCGAKTPEVVSEYEKHDESDSDSEPGPDPVTAILEPESELQLDSCQEEEEDVTLDVLSDADESLGEEVDDEAVESENSSLERDSERETTLRERFEKWCQTHGVVYGGKEEWLRRFEIYKTNLQHIDYHNSLNLSSKLSDNKFADLTEAEFRARYCGARTPEVVSEYEKHDESDFDSEHGPVTAILEAESELQLDSHQEEEEEEEDYVTLDVLSDDDESLDEKVEEDAVEES